MKNNIAVFSKIFFLITIMNFSSITKADVKILSYETRNGVKVLFSKSENIPMIDIKITFDAGSSKDGSLKGLSMLTHNLLDVTRLYCPTLERFIHCSTDEVYGESMLEVDEQHKTEQSVLCPTNPYAASKAAAEMLVQSYNHSFNMPIIITRGNNVYGPNQYPEKVIPRFIKQLKNREKVTIQGDGSCVRAFLHAYDTANAFITILEKGKIGEIYNIGCDEGMEYSILDVAKILIKKIHGTEDYSKWISYIEDRPFNDKRYYISNQKLRDLGWKININFDEGLDLLINDNF